MLCKLFSAKYLATLFRQNKLRVLSSTAYIKSYSTSGFSKIKKVSSWRFNHKKLKDTVCIYRLVNLCSRADLLTQRLKKLADVGMLKIKAYQVGPLRKKNTRRYLKAGDLGPPFLTKKFDQKNIKTRCFYFKRNFTRSMDKTL